MSYLVNSIASSDGKSVTYSFNSSTAITTDIASLNSAQSAVNQKLYVPVGKNELVSGGDTYNTVASASGFGAVVNQADISLVFAPRAGGGNYVALTMYCDVSNGTSTGLLIDKQRKELLKLFDSTATLIEQYCNTNPEWGMGDGSGAHLTDPSMATVVAFACALPCANKAGNRTASQMVILKTAADVTNWNLIVDNGSPAAVAYQEAQTALAGYLYIEGTNEILSSTFQTQVASNEKAQKFLVNGDYTLHNFGMTSEEIKKAYNVHFKYWCNHQDGVRPNNVYNAIELPDGKPTLGGLLWFNIPTGDYSGKPGFNHGLGVSGGEFIVGAGTAPFGIGVCLPWWPRAALIAGWRMNGNGFPFDDGIPGSWSSKAGPDFV